VSAAVGFAAVFACLIAVAGCSGGSAEVERVALEFVDAMKSQDPSRIEQLIDWELYYSKGNKELPEEKQVTTPEEMEEQKALLLRVLANDRLLAMRYLTADHTVWSISVDGSEARAEVHQVDRATQEKRVIELLMARSDGWKIYRFSTKDIGVE
jgi:hypothetical protein